MQVTRNKKDNERIDELNSDIDILRKAWKRSRSIDKRIAINKLIYILIVQKNYLSYNSGSENDL